MRISQKIAYSQWDSAKKELIFLVEKGRGGKEALLLYAQVLRGTKNYQEGLKLVLKAARDYPEELLFRLEEAKFHIDMSNSSEALKAFQVCAPVLRSESDMLDYASAYYEAGNYEMCLELLEPFLPSSKNGKLLLLVGKCFYAHKSFQDATVYFQKAIQLGYTDQAVVTELANAYKKLGNLSESEKLFRYLLDKDPKNTTALLGLGSCMQERRLFQKALLIYQSGPAWEKRDPRVLFQAGLCALFLKKYHHAECYFAEVIKEQGVNVQLLSYYGYSLECQQKWQEAEQNYLKQVQMFPSHPHGYRALAWLFGVGLSVTLSKEQGINFANIALKYLPDSLSWEILSACEARAGNFARAHQIQEHLIHQCPDKHTRLRHQNAMRYLRKNQPLDDHLVLRSLVA